MYKKFINLTFKADRLKWPLSSRFKEESVRKGKVAVCKNSTPFVNLSFIFPSRQAISETTAETVYETASKTKQNRQFH